MEYFHRLIDFFSTYYYLTGSLALLFLALLLMSLATKHRKPALISGLLSLPCALYAVVFVPEYWHPIQVFRWLAGPEDLIFSFANGCLVWIFSVTPFSSRQLHLDICVKRLLRRYFLLCAVFIPLLFGGPLLGLRIMDSFVVAAVAVWLVVFIRRHDLWPVTLSGMLFFTVFYTLSTSLLLIVNPEFLQQWNFRQLSGSQICGVPVEEVLWAAAFGATWPLAMAYGFEGHWKSRCKPTEPIQQPKDELELPGRLT